MYLLFRGRSCSHGPQQRRYLIISLTKIESGQERAVGSIRRSVSVDVCVGHNRYLATQAGSILSWLKGKRFEAGELFVTSSRLEEGEAAGAPDAPDVPEVPSVPDAPRPSFQTYSVLLPAEPRRGRRPKPHEDMLQVAVRAYLEAERGSIGAADQYIHQAVRNHLDEGLSSSMPMLKKAKNRITHAIFVYERYGEKFAFILFFIAMCLGLAGSGPAASLVNVTICLPFNKGRQS